MTDETISASECAFALLKAVVSLLSAWDACADKLDLDPTMVADLIELREELEELTD